MLTELTKLINYSAVILAVAHKEFKGLNLKATKDLVVYDVKSVLPKGSADARL